MFVGASRRRSGAAFRRLLRSVDDRGEGAVSVGVMRVRERANVPKRVVVVLGGPLRLRGPHCRNVGLVDRRHRFLKDAAVDTTPCDPEKTIGACAPSFRTYSAAAPLTVIRSPRDTDRFAPVTGYFAAVGALEPLFVSVCRGTVLNDAAPAHVARLRHTRSPSQTQINVTPSHCPGVVSRQYPFFAPSGGRRGPVRTRPSGWVRVTDKRPTV